jgi:hypothetical protein
MPAKSPTAEPTVTVERSATTVSDDGAGVEVYETTITLPTYPYEDYLEEKIDLQYNMPVFYFNRAGYEAARPTPAPVEYRGIVMENPYVRLLILPELGGRLYSAIIKATDQELFYHNPVVKPSRYGALQPYEANWWLATGGMEWAYPTQEHGYRFGVPWDYTVTQQPFSTTLTLSDTAPERVGMEVSISLPDNSSVFTVAPSVTNRGSEVVPVQVWTNAALALAPASMLSGTQFIVPTEAITVHSRGEPGWTVPDEGSQVLWPQVGDTDLRDYSQWANYLGFFVPNRETAFVGAYNEANDLGMVRLPAAGSLTGSGKIFAFGRNFPDRSYTDDDSQYFELWSGANSGFWPEDDIALPAGEAVAWQESWWPLAQLGGLTWVTADVAMYLDGSDGEYTLSALVSRPQRVKLTISNDQDVWLRDVELANPAEPLVWNFAAGPKPFKIKFSDTNNKSLLEYRSE